MWMSAACRVQGNSNEELPEVILGCARVSRIDFAQVRTGPDPHAGIVLDCTVACEARESFYCLMKHLTVQQLAGVCS